MLSTSEQAGLAEAVSRQLGSQAEFEPRLAGLRQRVAILEAEAAALQDAAEQTRSLQLVIGKLETFAALVRDQLDEADWVTRRDITHTLVRRIEIDDQHIRIVFRVAPGPQDGVGSRRSSQHCPGRHRAVADGHDRRGSTRRGSAGRGLTGRRSQVTHLPVSAPATPLAGR